MPHVSLRGLGLIGLIADKPTYELPDNAFSEISNIRFFDGTAQKSSIPIERYSINADSVWMEIFLQSDLVKYTYATNLKLYEINSGVSSDVSRIVGGAYTDTTDWQSMVWGESPLYNNGADVPQIMEPSDSEFKDLPNWPSALRTRVMRPFKSFMVALNVTDSGVEKPDFVQWSNEAEPGEVPDTWVPLPDNLAGGNSLGGESDAIIDGLELGDVFVVYTRTTAYEMQFIGGSLVMGFRKFTDNGVVNRNAVVAFDHFHFCVSNWSIYTHDGHSVNHIADQKVRDFLFKSVTNTESIRVEHIADKKEIFIYFEADGSGTGPATKALIWCYRYDTWTFIDLPGVKRIEFAAEQPDPVTYDTITTTYAEESRTYAQMTDTSLNTLTYFLGSEDDVIYNFDTQFGTGLSFKVERTGLDFDDTLGVPTNTIKYINELLPQISGTGDVDITLGFADTPEGVVTWGEPVTYNIETDYKIDVRNSGRYPAWRFEGDGEGNFKLSGIDFNVIIDGER